MGAVINNLPTSPGATTKRQSVVMWNGVNTGTQYSAVFDARNVDGTPGKAEWYMYGYRTSDEYTVSVNVRASNDQSTWTWVGASGSSTQYRYYQAYLTGSWTKWVGIIGCFFAATY